LISAPEDCGSILITQTAVVFSCASMHQDCSAAVTVSWCYAMAFYVYMALLQKCLLIVASACAQRKMAKCGRSLTPAKRSQFAHGEPSFRPTTCCHSRFQSYADSAFAGPKIGLATQVPRSFLISTSTFAITSR
jgi:hypothetical protein